MNNDIFEIKSNEASFGNAASKMFSCLLSKVQ